MMLATFMVTSAADSGAHTLRQAILDSNGTPGGNNIDFSITGSGVHTISLVSALPAITYPALVDGWSQGGTTYTGVPLVEIDGGGAGSGATGLDFAAGSSGSAAMGFVVSAFSGAGIVVSSDNDLVEGCYVGLNAAGTAALANGGDGILINSGASAATIGGTVAGARNVISGNSGDGVEITGTGASGNVVSGNLVGTNVAGTAAVANHAGVEIDSGAAGNLIGASGTSSVTDPLERNIISGNSFAGVWLTGTGTDNNVVAGNYIGTNAAGTGAVGNGSVVVFDPLGAGITGGVVIQGGAADNLVGTSGHSADDAGERNVISGNAHDGVDIYGSGTGGNVVAGNLIGTNAAATATLSNGYGVVLEEVTSTNWVGVNTIYGAEDADQSNVISGNSAGGIGIFDASESVVSGNLIGTNAAGTAALPNGDGLQIDDSSANLVGTSGQDGASDALERNVIAGNAYGIVILTGAFGSLPDPTSTGNVIAGNYIGTNPAGTGAVGNTSDGIEIESGASGNWIGVNTVYGAESARPGQRDLGERPRRDLDHRHGHEREYRRRQHRRPHRRGNRRPGQRRRWRPHEQWGQRQYHRRHGRRRPQHHLGQ